MRDLEAGAHPTHTLELEDVQWVAQPLDPSFTQISELEVTRNELGRVPSDKRLASIGHLLHPRGETDRVALRRVVHPQIAADLPDHDLAGVEAHPDGDPRPCSRRSHPRSARALAEGGARRNTHAAHDPRERSAPRTVP